MHLNLPGEPTGVARCFRQSISSHQLYPPKGILMKSPDKYAQGAVHFGPIHCLSFVLTQSVLCPIAVLELDSLPVTTSMFSLLPRPDLFKKMHSQLSTMKSQLLCFYQSVWHSVATLPPPIGYAWNWVLIYVENGYLADSGVPTCSNIRIWTI